MGPAKTIEDCQRIIERMLDHLPHDYHNTHTEIVWERGYLTGMLARLMMEDPRLRMRIERKAEDLALRSKK